MEGAVAFTLLESLLSLVTRAHIRLPLFFSRAAFRPVCLFLSRLFCPETAVCLSRPLGFRLCHRYVTAVVTPPAPRRQRSQAGVCGMIFIGAACAHGREGQMPPGAKPIERGWNACLGACVRQSESSSSLSHCLFCPMSTNSNYQW